jgi:prolyl-tRNA synthetase
VKSIVSSYRDLPLTAYQINTKFRDEIRPRFGVIRSKEFIMKDAYSFDMDEKGLEESYQEMRRAYRRIFDKCGLDTIPVEADTGNMGGSNSEEFMVASEVGEETLLLCKKCEYRANREKAEYKRNIPIDNSQLEELKKTDTPDIKTIDDLCSFFKCHADKFLKSLIYTADLKPVMVIVPGSREINEIKLKNHLKCSEIVLSLDSEVETVTGAPVGFAGPVTDKKIRIIFDLAVKDIKNAITGANEKDKHYTGVNSERDYKISEEADITSAEEGDLCPLCGTPLYVKKGIEVGHIFKLGYKYTKSMNVSVLDESGKSITPIMGCYGIGVNRTMAAIIEQNNDNRGIIWPQSVSPFDLHLVGIYKTDDEKKEIDKIYEILKTSGLDVLYDDRKASPGFKFADADLVGIPVRVIIGKGFFEKGEIEIKKRKTGEVEIIDREHLTKKINSLI